MILLCHAEVFQQVTSAMSAGLASLFFTGIKAGSVVITDTAVDASFQPRFEQVVLGDVVVRSTDLDRELAEELLACSKEVPDFPTLIGHTMCTYDFYEGKRALAVPPPADTVPSVRAAWQAEPPMLTILWAAGADPLLCS